MAKTTQFLKLQESTRSVKLNFCCKDSWVTQHWRGRKSERNSTSQVFLLFPFSFSFFIFSFFFFLFFVNQIETSLERFLGVQGGLSMCLHCSWDLHWPSWGDLSVLGWLWAHHCARENWFLTFFLFPLSFWLFSWMFLASFVNLTELHLGYNKLTALPDWVERIKRIHVNHNNFTTLPAWFWSQEFGVT